MPDFDAGKYGAYLWPAFAATAVVLGGLIVDSLARAGKWRREVERLEAEREAAKAKK